MLSLEQMLLVDVNKMVLGCPQHPHLITVHHLIILLIRIYTKCKDSEVETFTYS